jgi:hypothetical protein
MLRSLRPVAGVKSGLAHSTDDLYLSAYACSHKLLRKNSLDQRSLPMYYIILMSSDDRHSAPTLSASALQASGTRTSAMSV